MQRNSENLPSPTPRLTAIDPILAAFLALLLFGVYMVTFDGTLHSTDGLSMFAAAENLVKHGHLDVRQMENWEDSVALGLEGKPYINDPPGPTLFMAVFVALALAVPQFALTQTTIVLMPLATALTAIFIYLVARRLGYSRPVGVTITLLVGLATMAWPRSRDLVTDPVMLAGFAAAFYYAVAYRQDKRLTQAALMGLALGITFLFKTTNGIAFPLFLWYLAVPNFNPFNFKKIDWPALLIATGLLIFSLLITVGYNVVRFGNPLDSGFRNHIGFSTPFWIGFIGLLISPYKSIFLYLPLFILIPFFIRKIWQSHPRESVLILTLLFSNMVIFGSWHDWGGSVNWGPRYLAPLNGLLCLLSLPVIEQAFQPGQWRPRLVLIMFSLISLAMQILGLSARDNAFLGAATYWTPPPHLSYLGELTWDKPDQWPVWGHLLIFDVKRIPVIWRWEWQGLTHFDLLALLATLLIVVMGLAGIITFYRRERAAALWPGGAWLIAFACVALVLVRSYDDPRSIKRAEEADKLWPAYSALVAQLPELVQPNDAVIFTNRRFDYYLFDLDKSSAQRYVIAKDTKPRMLETIPKLLQEQAERGRVWLVTDPLDNRQLAYATELWLHQRGWPLEYHLFGDSVQLTAFEPDPTAIWTAAIPAQPQLAGLVDPDDYKFNGIAALLGWHWPGLELTTPLILQPGQVYPFELYWIYRGKDPSDLFFVRLRDSAGQKVAEVFTTPSSDTRFIPGRLMVEEARFVLPADLPSADYHLQIGFLTPAVPEGELTFDLPPEMTLVKVSDRQEAGRQ